MHRSHDAAVSHYARSCGYPAGAAHGHMYSALWCGTLTRSLLTLYAVHSVQCLPVLDRDIEV